MRVAVAHLTSGGFSGGYRKYLRELLPRLRQHDAITAVREFYPAAAGASAPSNESETFVNARALKKIVQSFRADVVFFPTQRWVACGGTPSVVMIRNMEPYVAPFEGLPFVERARNLARRTVATWACMRATRVIAVSEYVKDYAIRQMKIPPEKVGMVYHGVGQVAMHEQSAPDLGVPIQDCFVVAGSVRPARGLAEVIEAVALERKEGRAHTILIVGSHDRATERFWKLLHAKIEANGVRDLVRFAGQMSPSELAWCFSHCKAVLTATWAEACPNVALEAMAYGALIVSTSQQPMPEFFGDAALYFSPRDARSLAEKLRRASELSPALRAEMRELAQRRAAEFSWASTAERTVTELVIAASGRP